MSSCIFKKKSQSPVAGEGTRRCLAPELAPGAGGRSHVLVFTRFEHELAHGRAVDFGEANEQASTLGNSARGNARLP